MTTQTQTRLRRWSPLQLLAMAGVVLMLLLFSAVAGAAAGLGRNSIASFFIIGPIGLLALHITMHRFEWAVLALPIAALTIPFSMSTGTQTALPAALLLTMGLCGFWVFSMLARRTATIAPSLLNIPMLVFSIVCSISLVWGIAWRDPVLINDDSFIFVQVASLITILVSMGAALLIGNFVNNERQLQYIVGIFIVFGSLMMFTQLREIEQGLLNDKGLWALWTVIPAFCLVICKSKLQWYWRVLLLVIAILTMYQTMIVKADWISGWAPSIAAIAAASFFRSKRFFIVVLIIGIIAGYQSRDFFEKVANSNVEDGALGRLSLWDQNWRVVREHWMFGTGPAGYALYYMTYYKEDARSTHNNYLDIMAQFGFIGMITWLWLAFTAVVEGVRTIYRAPPGFLKTLAIIATSGWIGAQASMFFGDWILPFAYNQGVGGYKYTVYSWIFLGTIISIQQIMRRQAQPVVQSIQQT